MADGNGNRELGELGTRMDSLYEAQGRLEGKVDIIIQQLPKHEVRLDTAEKNITAQWAKWNGQPARIYSLIAACGVVGGAVAWVVGQIK